MSKVVVRPPHSGAPEPPRQDVLGEKELGFRTDVEYTGLKPFMMFTIQELQETYNSAELMHLWLESGSCALDSEASCEELIEQLSTMRCFLDAVALCRQWVMVKAARRLAVRQKQRARLLDALDEEQIIRGIMPGRAQQYKEEEDKICLRFESSLKNMFERLLTLSCRSIAIEFPQARDPATSPVWAIFDYHGIKHQHVWELDTFFMHTLKRDVVAVCDRHQSVFQNVIEV